MCEEDEGRVNLLANILFDMFFIRTASRQSVKPIREADPHLLVRSCLFVQIKKSSENLLVDPIHKQINPEGDPPIRDSIRSSPTDFKEHKMFRP